VLAAIAAPRRRREGLPVGAALATE
jgi:hypothetical protein